MWLTSASRAALHASWLALLAGCAGFSSTAVVSTAPAGNPYTLPLVGDAEVQPLKVHVQRLREALEFLGAPLRHSTLADLDAAAAEPDHGRALSAIQRALDPYCMAGLDISPEARVKATRGPAPLELLEQGWRLFLVKINNQAGVTSPLRVSSPQAQHVYGKPAGDIPDMWLDIDVFRDRPLEKTLSGIMLEYQIVALYSRDTGKRSAVLTFDVGHGTQDIGFRSDATLTFDAKPSVPITFKLADENGKPITAGLEIRDLRGRVYPAQNKRLAPDFFFQAQVYREDGESIRLPEGTFNIRVTHGPEYLPVSRRVALNGQPRTLAFRLQRWIDPSALGWWSGDHHIHAAGCKHYNKPTEGVEPAVMLRHIRGEDLKVGASLNWGPSFDFQKQFFTGHESAGSRAPYILRHDVEVSGFGSHRSGHLVLLGLREQIFPGGDSKNHWPTLGLNTLRWAQKQGAVCGPAHSGWGLAVPTADLPNYAIPKYDGIGANEYIVDVTHEVPGPVGTPVPAVDFLSMVDTPLTWEMNVWYHTLNAGFRTRISGESDFPCIYDERVGMGRSYVAIDGPLTYDRWISGIEAGRAYVGDGMSHLVDFKVNGAVMGQGGSEVRMGAQGKVRVSVRVAALLPPEPDASVVSYARAMPGLGNGTGTIDTEAIKPYWNIERARQGKRRAVPLDVIVNGQPVAAQPIVADGTLKDVSFEIPIQRSSWMALRILGSSHTNPIFIVVGDKPICASKRSVQWLRASVDVLWESKKFTYAPAEMADAEAAYGHARAAYDRLLKICESP